MTTPQFYRADVFTVDGVTIKGVNRVNWPQPLPVYGMRKTQGSTGLRILNAFDLRTVAITTEGPIAELERKNGQEVSLTLTRSFVTTTETASQNVARGGQQIYVGKGMVSVPNEDEGADVTDGLEAREYTYNVGLHVSVRNVRGGAGEEWDMDVPAGRYNIGGKTNVLGIAV